MQMTETQTLARLDLPRTKSSSNDSFSALMHVVLDSARASGGSLESTATSGSTTSTSSSAGRTAETASSADTADSSKTSASGDGGATAPTPTTSDARASAGIAMKGPSLTVSGRTASTSTTSSSNSLSVPATSTASAPASAASSTTPSPCPSILRSSSSSLTLPSRTGSPSITFAPLPTTEPRKRSGVQPLGVAARSRLLRHRRMLREQGLHPDDVPYPHSFSGQDQDQSAQYYYRYGPGSGVQGGLGVMDDPPVDAGRWGEEIREAEAGVDADEDARARAVSRCAKGSRGRTVSDPGEGDALVSLGRLVKGAGKSLWRSISMKEVRSKETKAADASTDPGAGQDAHLSAATTSSSVDAMPEAGESSAAPSSPSPKGRTATLPRKTEVHLFDDTETRTPSAEGGVWEEDIDEQSLKRLLAGPQAAPATDGQEAPLDRKTPRTSIEPVANVKRSKRSSTMEVFAARIR